VTRIDLGHMLLDTARSHGLTHVSSHVLEPWPHVIGRSRDGLPVVVCPTQTHRGVRSLVRPAWRRHEVGDGPPVLWRPIRGRRWRGVAEMGRDAVAHEWRAGE